MSKKRIVKTLLIAQIVAANLMMSTNAEVVISDVPYSETISSNEPGPTYDTSRQSDGPQPLPWKYYDSPRPLPNTTKATDSKLSAQEASAKIVVSPAEVIDESQKTYVRLISPNHQYGSSYVTRAKVKLSDGTWVDLDYKDLIRRKYYRITGEITDDTGSWYVVAADAKKIGNYTAKDGEKFQEVLFNKEDCTLVDKILLDTKSSKRVSIVNTAFSLLGKGYSYAANGPDEFDCSGLVKYIYDLHDISLPRTSSELCEVGTGIDIDDLVPGDIVARVGHAGIYIGDGYFIHASDSSNGVVVEDLKAYNLINKFTDYRSVI